MTTSTSKISTLWVFLFFITTVLMLPSSVHAATYYVDSVSGNDTNTGTSQSQPWKTMSKINSASLQAGDSVLLKRGSVFSTNSSDGISITGKSGTSANPITLSHYGETADPLPVISATSHSVYLNSSNWWIIDGVRVENATDGGIWVENSNNLTIKNNYATNVGIGFLLGGNNLTVHGNTVEDPKMRKNTIGGDDDSGALGYGIVGSDIELYDNICRRCIADSYDYGTDGGGFEIYAYQNNVNNIYIHNNWVEDSDGFMEIGAEPGTNLSVTNVLMSYNVSYNNQYRLLHFNTGTNYNVIVDNIRFEHNTAINTSIPWDTDLVKFTATSLSGNELKILDNIIYGYDHLSHIIVTGERPSDFVHERNIFYGMNSSEFQLGAGESTDDPLFVDLAGKDLGISENSPAIDAGNTSANLSATVINTDYEYNTIPSGSAADIGAFEHQQSLYCPIAEDINEDGIVDLRDYSLLVTNFFSTEPDPSRADINTDGIVDLRDYSRLVSKFFQSCDMLTPTPTAAQASALKDAAASSGIHIGAAIHNSAIDGTIEQEYFETFETEFNSATAENAMKMHSISKGYDDYDFSKADQFVDYATQQGLNIHGHTLLWHSDIPSWLENGGYSSEEIEQWTQQYITTVVSRYKGKINSWDVINEPMNDPAAGGTLRTDSFWYIHLGPDYIHKALSWARSADADAKLFINEYSTLWENEKTAGLYNLTTQLIADGAPLDGIGFQAHNHVDLSPPYSKKFNGMKQFADLGLAVAITEHDIKIDDTSTITDTILDTQASQFADTVNACLAINNCIGITFWGFTDKYSWLNSRGGQGGLIFDENYMKKPAYDAILNVLL